MAAWLKLANHWIQMGMVELRGGMADPRRDLRDAEAKASDAMILGGEDSVAAGQMNGGVQYIVRAVPKGRARWSPGAETAPWWSGALAASGLLFFFFWRLGRRKM